MGALYKVLLLPSWVRLRIKWPVASCQAIAYLQVAPLTMEVPQRPVLVTPTPRRSSRGPYPTRAATTWTIWIQYRCLKKVTRRCSNRLEANPKRQRRRKSKKDAKDEKKEKKTKDKKDE